MRRLRRILFIFFPVLCITVTVLALAQRPSAPIHPHDEGISATDIELLLEFVEAANGVLDDEYGHVHRWEQAVLVDAWFVETDQLHRYCSIFLVDGDVRPVCDDIREAFLILGGLPALGEPLGSEQLSGTNICQNFVAESICVPPQANALLGLEAALARSFGIGMR